MAFRRLVLLVCIVFIVPRVYHEKHYLMGSQQHDTTFRQVKLASLAHPTSKSVPTVTVINVPHGVRETQLRPHFISKRRYLSSTGTRKKRWLETKQWEKAADQRKPPIRNPIANGSTPQNTKTSMDLSNRPNCELCALPDHVISRKGNVRRNQKKCPVFPIKCNYNDTNCAKQSPEVNSSKTTNTIPRQDDAVRVLYRVQSSMTSQPLFSESGVYNIFNVHRRAKFGVDDTTQNYCKTDSRGLPKHCRLVSGDVDETESRNNKEIRDFSIVLLVLTVSFLGDGDIRQKLKSVLKAVCNVTGTGQLIQTAIKGLADTDKKMKSDFEDNTPLWRRFSTFTPTLPVFYTVYPATSFLPGVGSSGRDAMAHLGCRLASFAALPASCNVSRSRLAQAGFYYDSSKTSRNGSNSHEVVCFSCGVTWSSWEASDNPMVIHRRLRPDCDYIKSQGPDVFPQSTSRRSISSGPSSLSSLSTFSTDSSFSSLSSASSLTSWSSTSTDFSQASSGFGVGGSSDQGDLATDCAAIAPAPLPPGHAPYSSQSGAYSNQSGASARNNLAYLDDHDDRAQICMDSAVYPQFFTMSERLATFQGWPLGQYFKPDDLVYDGFYYAGYADCLRCFYCGVGLKSWDRNDSVMDEHIRWRPRCGYILAVKGRRFVNMTLQRITAARPDEDSQTTINAGSTGSDVARNGASNQVVATPRSTSTIGSATVPANTNGSAAQRTTLSTNSEAIQKAKEIGFSDELIARATRDLVQQSEGWINTAVFIEYLTDLTTVPNNDTTQSSVNGDLHTDGAHCLEVDTRSQRAQEVMQENERLRSMRRCKICNKGTVGVIFMPCGHLLACTDCAGRTRNCSRCGQYIRATANVYLS